MKKRNKKIKKLLDDFLHRLLSIHKPIGNEFDWVRIGTTTRILIHPPKIPENIDCFEDALKEVVREKLEIALNAQETFGEPRKKRIKMILDEVPEDQQWFYFALEKYLFAEYFIIGEWIRYLLDIWERINKDYNPPIRPHRMFSDIEMERARNYPIERLHKGKLRSSGKRFVGLCPFHQERTPSFFIFENNRWHCFGACSTGGDSISFLMKLENIGFIEAVRRLNGYY